MKTHFAAGLIAACAALAAAGPAFAETIIVKRHHHGMGERTVVVNRHHHDHGWHHGRHMMVERHHVGPHHHGPVYVKRIHRD